MVVGAGYLGAVVLAEGGLDDFAIFAKVVLSLQQVWVCQRRGQPHHKNQVFLNHPVVMFVVVW